MEPPLAQPLQVERESVRECGLGSDPSATRKIRASLRRWLVLAFTLLAILAGGVLLVHIHSSYAHDSSNLDASGPIVYPVRLLFFRHGFTCANAGSTAGCADPDAPLLHLSAKKLGALYDKLDSIGTQLPAPRVLPPINRSFDVLGRGRKDASVRPPRQEIYSGEDCALKLNPPTDQQQWHQAENIVRMHCYIRDPVLTRCSEFQTEKAGQNLRPWLKNEGIKLDFLGASVLGRTFQTAFHQLLMDRKAWSDIFTQEMLQITGMPLVSQLPFLKEFNTAWGYQADNVAWPIPQQRQHLENAVGKKAVRHLDHSHLEGFTHEERYGHDWKAFKDRLLGPRLLPFILKNKNVSVPTSISPNARNGDSFSRAKWGDAAREAAGRAGKVEDILNIGMASHGGIISEVCRLKADVQNNAVYEMLLLVEFRGDGSEVVVRQESGTCEMVMGAPKSPKVVDHRDVANCVHPFDFTGAFVRRGSGSSRTECQELALAPDAYPTRPAAKLVR